MKSFNCAQRVLRPVNEIAVEKQNPVKIKTVKTLIGYFSHKNTYNYNVNYVGGIKNKENMAIYANDSTDHIDIQSLLQVPDDKGL